MAEPTEALTASLDALGRFLVGELTLAQTLQNVAELGEAAIPGADLTGLTLLTAEGETTTAVCTAPETVEVDQIQYERGDGPCLAAFREMQLVSVPSMRAESRWPRVSDGATHRGVNSSLSAPLIVKDRGIGALNFYSRREKAFSDLDAETAEMFAVHAAVVLANAHAYWRALEKAEQLEQALASRATIDQAKGVLIEQTGISPEEAFDLLRRASQRENRKLREIAAEIVKRAQERHRE
jgi:GAF domain-containing protein